MSMQIQELEESSGLSSSSARGQASSFGQGARDRRACRPHPRRRPQDGRIRAARQELLRARYASASSPRSRPTCCRRCCRYCRSYPGLELHIRETQTLPLTARADRGQARRTAARAAARAHRDCGRSAVRRTFLSPTRGAPDVRTRSRAARISSPTSAYLLLEEGHCLRDQALAYCSLKQVSKASTRSASRACRPLTEMVAAGFGITLLAGDVPRRGNPGPRASASCVSSSHNPTAKSALPGAPQAPAKPILSSSAGWSKMRGVTSVPARARSPDSSRQETKAPARKPGLFVSVRSYK